MKTNLHQKKKLRINPCISMEQALIMALRMHVRGDCGLPKAMITALELRYQVNFLDQLNVERSEFEWLIGRERDILSDWH